MLIDRYMARLMLRPLAICLCLAALLLLIDRLRRLLDFVVQWGGPVDLVWRMLANTVPSYVSYGLTLGLLLAVQLTVRRLALGAELDVLRATGVSYWRLLRVPFAIAGVLAAANLIIVGWVQPRARYINERLQFDLRSGALGAIVRSHEFAPMGRHSIMRIERVEPGGRLIGVFLRAQRLDGSEVTVTADNASVLAAPDRNALTFRLRHGTAVTTAPGQAAPRILHFASHDLAVPLPAADIFRSRGGTGRYEELTMPELAGLSRPGGPLRMVANHARAELHFRLAEVAAMFVLPLIGLGLGVPPKRSSSALGLVVAIPLVVFWFKVNGYAAGVAAAGRIGAVPALWGPFLLMLGLGLWMVVRLDRTPGGSPIARLEGGWARMTGWWRRRRAR